MQLFREVQKQLSEDQTEELINETEEFDKFWEEGITEEITPAMNNLVKAAMIAAAVELGLSATLLVSTADKFISGYVKKFAKEIVATSIDEIKLAIKNAKELGLTFNEMTESFNRLFDSWDKNRVAAIARTETIRAANRGARFVYQQAGIIEMQWVASRDACPYCKALDGTIVGVFDDFVPMGGKVMPIEEEAEKVGNRPFINNFIKVESPPLHVNCRCTIIPVRKS